MSKVVPWAALVELIAPYYPQGKTGRPPFSLHTMLRIHFMQQWFTLSYPGLEEALFDTPVYREFAQLEEFDRLPDESTVLRFRHRLEKHKLAEKILGVMNEILIQRGLLLKTGTVLEQQAVLERIQGSGTYVRKTPGTSQIYELFRLELADGPGLPTAHILEVNKLARPAHLAAITGRGEPCWRVRRLRYLSQQPVALEEIWFSASACPTLKAAELGDSMYLFYQQRLGVWIARVEDQISAAAAPPWVTQPLALQAGDCSGYIERISWTASNQIAEFSKTWFDPAVCRYSSRMSQ